MIVRDGAEPPEELASLTREEPKWPPLPIEMLAGPVESRPGRGVEMPAGPVRQRPGRGAGEVDGALFGRRIRALITAHNGLGDHSAPGHGRSPTPSGKSPPWGRVDQFIR